MTIAILVQSPIGDCVGRADSAPGSGQCEEEVGSEAEGSEASSDSWFKSRRVGTVETASVEADYDVEEKTAEDAKATEPSKDADNNNTDEKF